MKAFLASSIHLNEVQLKELLALVGKERVNKVLIISSAVVPYGEPRPDWFLNSLLPLRTISHELVETTLEDGDFIPESLDEYDFIYVSGGNVFYLAYRLQVTGWDKVIKDYIQEGGVYSGSSAGAIIMMDDIEHFAPADDPAEAPHICRGLGFLDFAIIPHADHPKYAPIMSDIATVYKQEGADVVMLHDDQVLRIDGDNPMVI